jgi:hypothetical protein
MTTKNIGFADYVMGADEQYIISNSAKIPVMCINPMSDLLQVDLLLWVANKSWLLFRYHLKPECKGS